MFLSIFRDTISMRKENIVHSRTCVYNINYHIVFSTKYRRKVLTPSIEARLQEILVEIADSKGFVVRMAEVGEGDHVHVFASAHPKIAPSYIAKMIKGVSARKLFIEFPKIKEKLWGGHLWNPSYYIESIGSISEDAIKKYIAKQNNHG